MGEGGEERRGDQTVCRSRDEGLGKKISRIIESILKDKEAKRKRSDVESYWLIEGVVEVDSKEGERPGGRG